MTKKTAAMQKQKQSVEMKETFDFSKLNKADKKAEVELKVSEDGYHISTAKGSSYVKKPVGGSL